MPKTIIVPLLDPNFDYVGVSERALPYAHTLMQQYDSRLILVSVIDMMPEQGELRSGMSEEFAAEREQWMEGWISERRKYLEDVASRFPGGRVETVVRKGDTRSQILDLVASVENPMLVMGSHARTGAARLMYGSVTFDVIHDVDAPVLTVRRRLPEPSDARLQKILVPLDGSGFAEQVIPAVLDVLSGDALEFHLLHVIDLGRTPPDAREREPERTPYQWAKSYLPKVADYLDSRGHHVTWNIHDGTIADEIITAAREQGCDLIAMATASRGGLSRLVFGSVAEKVLHDSGLPLLLFRPWEKSFPPDR